MPAPTLLNTTWLVVLVIVSASLIDCVVTPDIAPAVDTFRALEAMLYVPAPALIATLSFPSPSVAAPLAVNAPVDVNDPENVAAPAEVIVKRVVPFVSRPISLASFDPIVFVPPVVLPSRSQTVPLTIVDNEAVRNVPASLTTSLCDDVPSLCRFAAVTVAALIVTASPLASPKVVLPLNVELPVTARVPPNEVFPVALSVPATNKFSPIPAPPVTFNAPVVVLVDPVLSDMVNAEPNVFAPLTVCVPSVITNDASASTFNVYVRSADNPDVTMIPSVPPDPS